MGIENNCAFPKTHKKIENINSMSAQRNDTV